jgi:peptidoglycan/xylan/chitin deacetylase (PgdA/CDA1 family)
MEELINKTGHRLFLPFYHCVANGTPVHIKHLYQARTIEQFEADLDFFCKHFKPIGLEDVIELNGKQPKDPSFHLTFDDGLSEFHSIVAPILKQRKIPATVFLNTDFVDNKGLFYRFKESVLFEESDDKEFLKISYKDAAMLDIVADANRISFDYYLNKEKPYLTSEQIKELINQGFTFGAHSKDHPLYNELSLKDQINQTKESIETVTSQFNLDYKTFSFPFTDDGVSAQFFDEIINDVDVTFGCAGIKDDSAKNHLQRLAMESNKSGEEIVKAEYLYYVMKGKAGKHKIVRQ